ncbi:LacI family DNA-binding transcriptional regulator [Litchfieldia salsa]|uniref:DNA-binding transcriptional regulator, LacI/PurR family n=1 Tax=Litchfieldia salsa TaxID=930152 RepID=A0A1H0UPS8_9BACI|nr:LacI family DNA-binding transcriptional regulator [Litchfieldia salsa]SDP67958.1 DNA-binding transcriptional regulator, LacI/PurR family [Litchfieldia salsa]
MSTIEDVARLAGLSRTTVSRVINNHPYVSIEKKQLVISAMNQLGYVPNSAARSLRNQKTGMLAVLIPRITNPFFSQLIESMEIEASDKGYQLIVCQTRYSKKKELTYLNLLKTKQVDGVIMASIQNDWELIEGYLQYGPIILCNEEDENATVPVIHVNQEYGGYIAAKHLVDQGHQRIAFSCRSLQSKVAKKREVGFLKALKEADLTFDENFAFRDAASIQDGKEVFHRIREMKDKPSAIFSSGDEVAAGIISEARRYGWRIPEDLAVIGFDNQAIAELMQPTISTVHQPIQQMASIALATLVDRLHSKKFHLRQDHILTVELVIRESTVSQNNVQLVEGDLQAQG